MGVAMRQSAAVKLGVVLLVLLVLILGIPLALPMAGGACPECPGLGTSSLVGLCLAILVGLLLMAWAAGTSMLAERRYRAASILARPFERPPRSA